MVNFKGISPLAIALAAISAVVFMINEGSFAGAMLVSAFITPLLCEVFAPRDQAHRRFVWATVSITLLIGSVGVIGLYFCGVNAFTKASAPYTMPMMLGSIFLMVVLVKWLFPPDGDRNTEKKVSSVPQPSAQKQRRLRVVK